MYLPIGISCNTAKTLINLNLRKCSYPFDWVNCTLKDIYRILQVILTDDIDKFCDKLFSLQNEVNKMVYLSYNNSYYYSNEEYNISFPHDDYNTIIEKYKRRFHRLKQDFFTADKVCLVFISRYTYHDEDLINIVKFLRSFRCSIELLTINAWKNELEYIDDVKVYNVNEPYPEYAINSIKEQNIWIYDNSYEYKEILKKTMEKLIKK